MGNAGWGHRMWRDTLIALFALVLTSSVAGAQGASDLTNESILQLVRWHFSDDEIIAAIKRNQTHFDLSPSSVADLTAKGTPASVLAAMKGKLVRNSAPAGTGTNVSHDEVFFVDGAIAKGKILFVHCSPGATAPALPSLQFQSSEVQAKSSLSISALQKILLADGAIALSSTADPAQPVPPEVIAYLRNASGAFVGVTPRRGGAPMNMSKALVAACSATDHYWQGTVSSSAAYAVGTQSQKQIGGTLATSYTRNPYVYNWNYQIARLDLEAKYTLALKAGAPSIKSQEFYYGDFNYSFHPTKQFSPYVMARLYHNYSLGLDLGQIYGVGVDYRFKGLSLSGGLVGITDRLYAPGTPFTSSGARIFESYSSTLPFGKIFWFESVDIFPAFQLAKAVQGRGIVGFGIPLSKRIQLTPKLVDDYLGNAPQRHRFNYSNTSLGLDVKLGRNQ